MKIKLFEASSTAKLEELVNRFLQSLDPKKIIDTRWHFTDTGKYGIVIYKP